MVGWAGELDGCGACRGARRGSRTWAAYERIGTSSRGPQARWRHVLAAACTLMSTAPVGRLSTQLLGLKSAMCQFCFTHWCHPHGVQPTVQDGKRRGTELQKRADLVGPAESERPIPSVRRGCCWKPAPVKAIRVHCGQFQYNGRLGPVISCQKKLWKGYCLDCLVFDMFFDV